MTSPEQIDSNFWSSNRFFFALDVNGRVSSVPALSNGYARQLEGAISRELQVTCPDKTFPDPHKGHAGLWFDISVCQATRTLANGQEYKLLEVLFEGSVGPLFATADQRDAVAASLAVLALDAWPQPIGAFSLVLTD